MDTFYCYPVDQIKSIVLSSGNHVEVIKETFGFVMFGEFQFVEFQDTSGRTWRVDSTDIIAVAI